MKHVLRRHFYARGMAEEFEIEVPFVRTDERRQHRRLPHEASRRRQVLRHARHYHERSNSTQRIGPCLDHHEPRGGVCE